MVEALSVAVFGFLQWTFAPCALATSAMFFPSVDTQTESNSEMNKQLLFKVEQFK